jgi:hypothetical protein
MNQKYSTMLFRILILIITAFAGGLLYPVVANLMIIGGLFPENAAEENLAFRMTELTVYVWLGSVVISLAWLFLHGKWARILPALPLIAPSIFALIYILSV